MKKEKIKLALNKLGYRPMGNSSVLGKPIGWHILAFNLDTNEWFNMFTSINGSEALFWETKTFNDLDGFSEEEFINTIKNFECYTSINKKGSSSFEFLTKEEYYNNLL